MSDTPTLTISKVNEVLRRIAYKIGNEQYGLNGEEDFRILYFPWRRHAWRMRRLGSAVGVYFGVFPLDKDFRFYLDQALAAVKRVLDGKPQIELASRIKERMLVNSNWQSLPKLPPYDELVVEEVYKVVVRHRKTGVLAVREMHKPSFSKMVLEARIEIAETLSVIEIEERKLP